MNDIHCNSCNRALTNLRGSTSFQCPKCLEETIYRCFYCRRLAAKYHCSKCSFEGPN